MQSSMGVRGRKAAVSLLLGLLLSLPCALGLAQSVATVPDVGPTNGCWLVPLGGFASNASGTVFTVQRYCNSTALRPYFDAGWTVANNCTDLNSPFRFPRDTCNAYWPTLLQKFQGCPLDQTLQNGQCVCEAGKNWEASVNACRPQCPAGQQWIEARSGCFQFQDLYLGEPRSCPRVNNPIYPLTGVKAQDFDLGLRIGGQSVSLTYDTSARLPGRPADADLNRPHVASFGPLWRSSLHKSLYLQSPDGTAGAANSSVLLNRGSGVVAAASRSALASCAGGDGGATGAVYSGLTNRAYKVSFDAGTAALVDDERMTLESYLADGAVANVYGGRGGALSYAYSDAATPVAVAPKPGLLIGVTDVFGRSIGFEYEQPTSGEARVVVVRHNGEVAVRASYNSQGNLTGLRWANGEEKTFVYEHALGWPMTGVVDENRRRHATYGYDAQGRAISTEHAGGVNRSSVTYVTPPSWSVSEVVSGSTVCREHRSVAPSGTRVLNSLGQTNHLEALDQRGRVSLSSQSQPAGSGCAAAVSAYAYDANGNIASRNDFNGKRTCYARDAMRNLESVRVEGLDAAAVCTAVIDSSAALPANSRKVSTQWHPGWRLETKVAEPGRIVTSVYNGQSDPFNGNAIASCAPASALLPDGKPIAVLCKRVEQATTDANGALGLAAALQSGVPARTTTWTYNQWGQVLTENGPRTDVNDTTTYTYYSDTSFAGEGAAAVGHFMGDLATVTNAAGKVTQYTKYNKHGQVLESVDPNGVLTVNTYDLRQRLLSTTVGGQTTSYSYDPVGQLKRVTLPDQSWIGYDYDDAHRQVAVYDHKGNRVDYQLDNAGNRIGEQTKDPGGALKRQLNRSIDALGRVQQTTGRE